jgi:putative transposase
MLAMGLGNVEGVARDHVRHDTTTLLAALDVAQGSAITQCKAQHRRQEFLGFLRQLDAQAPANLDIHRICDNDATPKHAEIEAWLARHPRDHLDFTPTYRSWLKSARARNRPSPG